MEGVTALSKDLTQEQAKEKWQEYCGIIKTHPTDHAKTLKAAYHALSKGHQVIDIYEAFKLAGKYDNDMPKLAISRAHETKVVFERRDKGAGGFWGKSNYRNVQYPQVAIPKGIFSDWDLSLWPKGHWNDSIRTVETIVPTIPAKFYPAGKLERYFILWEVERDGWDPVPEPPGDPFLLRRISGNLFVVLAVWDLTDLEKAVIRGAILEA